MSRSVLYIAVLVLAVAAAVAGYLYYQESQSGIDIEINDEGVSINGN